MESKRIQKGSDLFKAGYNCAQATLGAFLDLTDLEFDNAMLLASSFGGGMGRMRSVCGAVTGMFMAAGLILGYSGPETGTKKANHYELIRNLAEEFKAENGSIVCGELLEGVTVGGTPEPRTESYYKKRPCGEYVKSAIRILEKHIENNDIQIP